MTKSSLATRSRPPTSRSRSQERESAQVCPHFHAAVELIGARWSGAILRALMLGHTRFAEIRAAVPGLSDTMLSQRLRELEAAGVVHRDVLPTTPVRVGYGLTEAGRELEPVLEGLVDWAHQWVQPADHPTRPGHGPWAV